MHCDRIDNVCYFLNDDYERASGVVVGKIVWRGDHLAIISVDDGGHEDFFVRPVSMISTDPDATIGFAHHDDTAMAAIQDLVLAHRYA